MKDLDQLNKRYIAAKTAYFEYRTDGTVDGDIEEIKLLHKYTAAEKEYRNALNLVVEELRSCYDPRHESR